jgi:hypothetical protein
VPVLCPHPPSPKPRRRKRHGQRLDHAIQDVRFLNRVSQVRFLPGAPDLASENRPLGVRVDGVAESINADDLGIRLDGSGLCSQELPPGRARSSWSGVDPGVLGPTRTQQQTTLRLVYLIFCRLACWAGVNDPD